jgi:calcineurin-like phosphoesterase family protein
MGDLWFTADNHFHHGNIIKYCSRPFRNRDHMNGEMIKRWNKYVRPNDVIVHLGDFALCSKAWATELLAKLNGTKILVRGNHDGSIKKNEDIGFALVCDQLLMKVGGITTMLSHRLPEVNRYPLITGHVHEKWSRIVKDGFPCVNVGVDRWDFRPISEQVVAMWLK